MKIEDQNFIALFVPSQNFWLYIPGSTDLGPILFAHAVHAWANVVITQGVSNIGPGLDRVRKQYWAKNVQNFATRDILVFY